MKCFAINYYKIYLFFSFSLLFTYGLNAQITSYPYAEDFESGSGGWTVQLSDTSTWELGVPSSSLINSAASGNNAWVTNLAGTYENNEEGYLLSPAFDLSSLTNATVEFNLWWNCEYAYDGVVLQSSIDGQLSWQNVGTVGSGNNWFNYTGIVSNPGDQTDPAEGWSGRNSTGNGSGGWITVSQEINHLIGQPNVYFRLFFATDVSVVDEGIGFDLFKLSSDCDLFIVNTAESLLVVYDGTGNQTEVDNWLATNGGALVNSDACGDVTWSYNILNDNLFDDTLTVLIGFTATDDFGNEAFSSASIFYEQFAVAGESTGTNGVLCGIESYNLGSITGLNPNDTKFENSDFETSQVSGPPDAQVSGVVVDFPDTGAGQFAYSFRVEVNTSVTIGESEPLNYSSEAFLTVNDVTIPFDPGPDKTVPVCDFDNLSLAALYEQLDIAVDVDDSGFSFTTSDDFFPEDYWFDLDDNPITEITEPGTYKFNPRAFLPDCGAEVTLVTVVEQTPLLAGDNATYNTCQTFDESDLFSALGGTPDPGGFWTPEIVQETSADYTYTHPETGLCPGSSAIVTVVYNLTNDTNENTVEELCYTVGTSVNLNDYLDTGVEVGGTWVSVEGGATISEGDEVLFPDTGVGTASYVFSYENFNPDTCIQYFLDLTVDVSIDAIPYVGEDRFADETCYSFTTINLNDYLDSDAERGGTWESLDGISINNDVVDFPDTGAGQFTYNFRYSKQNSCGQEDEAFIEVVVDIPEDVFAGEDVADEADIGIVNLNTFLDLNSGLITPDGQWEQVIIDSEPVLEISEDDGVDFPDTGAGQITYTFTYTVDNGCGSSDVANIVIDVIIEGNPGGNGALEICNGSTITEPELFGALTGTPDDFGTWSPELAGAGVYTYTIDGNIATVTVTESPIHLDLKVYLQGALLNPNVGEENLMRDDLRVLNLLPETSPYPDTMIVEPGVFDVTGNNAIVDWVWIELRNASNGSDILEDRSALLQRDGDIVDVNGTSAISIGSTSGNYFVVIKHRNHLSAMIANPIQLVCTAVPTSLDFSSLTTDTYGSDAQVTMNANVNALWAGDSDVNKAINFAGNSADSNSIKDNVLNDPSNFLGLITFISTGYLDADIDMNGSARFSGSPNDTNIVKDNVINHPANFLGLPTFTILGTIPGEN